MLVLTDQKTEKFLGLFDSTAAISASLELTHSGFQDVGIVHTLGHFEVSWSRLDGSVESWTVRYQSEPIHALGVHL